MTLLSLLQDNVSASCQMGTCSAYVVPLSQMLRPYPDCCAIFLHVHADAELQFGSSALHLRF